MYELRTAIIAEPSLRKVRERALPSLRHQRVHAQALRLVTTPAVVASTSGTGLLARVGALMTRRPGPMTPSAEHTVI